MPAISVALDRVLVRLAQVTGREPTPTRKVGGYTADCPVKHFRAGQDTLHVRAAKDGRIVLICRDGCATKVIAHALGMDVSDLYPRGENGVVDDRVVEENGLPMAIRAIDAPPPEPIAWCVEELLVTRELALFAGDGGSFKTTSGLHIAGAVAGGYSAFNRFPTHQRPALVLSAEDSRDVVFNRLEAIVQGQGWDRVKTLSNVHVLASHEAKLSDPQWQAHLLEHAARLDCGFIFLDPLAELIDGDENSNTDVRPVIKFARRLTAVAGAAVVINHHASKVREGQRAIDRVRGASALRDAARCVLFFDSGEAGIAVEHLKMSRSEKLKPFVLTREIESEADNHATWVSARFVFQTKDAAALSRAETFILDQVTAAPKALNSTDLRTRGAVAGINGEDLSKGQKDLQARGLLDFVPGPNRSKLWVAVTHEVATSDESAALASRPSGLAQPAGGLSGRSEGAPHLAESLKPSACPVGADRQTVARGTMQTDEPELADLPEEFDL
jgi:hypothetical protein